MPLVPLPRCTAVATVSEEEGDWSDSEGVEGDIGGQLQEAAQAAALAQVIAQLQQPAQLGGLDALRARAACALSQSRAELSLSLSTQCAQLEESSRALSRAVRGATALRCVARDVANTCEVRYLATPPSLMAEVPLSQQEAGPRRASVLATLRQLSAAQANTAAVARSVHALQRDLPRALTALQSRIATADLTSADDLEDIYAELSKLDAQGLVAAAALERSATSSVTRSSSGSVPTEAALAHIAVELDATWTSLRAMMLGHMHSHSRLARHSPGVLVRAAQLAEVHDAASRALQQQAGAHAGVRLGIMHAGDASLSQACAACVREAFKEHVDAALCNVSSRALPSTDVDAEEAAVHALARADAVLLAHQNFDTAAARCFPPSWRLDTDVRAIAASALVAHLRQLALRADALSNDDILRCLAWADGVEGEVAEDEDFEEPAALAARAPFHAALSPAREVYLKRVGDAVRGWVENILKREAAAGVPPAPPLGGDSTLGASAIVQTAAPVDIFRLVHDQARAVRDGRGGCALCGDVAALHMDVLEGYAASLFSTAKVVLRDAKGELAPGALERLLCGANNSFAAARNTESEFGCTASSAPPQLPNTPTTPGGARPSPASVLTRQSFGGEQAPSDDGTLRAAALAASFDAASRACLYRIAELMLWDVESVLWRLFTPARYATEAAAAATAPAALRSALATLDDYLGDLSLALLPPLFAELVVECAKRSAVTYSAQLLVGPPLAPAEVGIDAGLADAARLCISGDIHALRVLFETWRAPRPTLDGLSELLTVACELATASGPATAQRAAACVAAEYGPTAVPITLLRRMVTHGVWSAFSASLKFTDDALAEMLAAAPTLGAPPVAAKHARRRSVTWALSTFVGKSPLEEATQPDSPPQMRLSAAPPPIRLSLAAYGCTSFAYAEADASLAGQPEAALAEWRASFFMRVEGLCAKRAGGARPQDSPAGGEDYPVEEGAGPWSRLGALKRRATLWPWSKDSAAEVQPDVKHETGWAEGPPAAVKAERRKTMFF